MRPLSLSFSRRSDGRFRALVSAVKNPRKNRERFCSVKCPLVNDLGDGADRPINGQTSKRRAAEPACPSRRFFIRLAARGKDCSDDESWVFVRRCELASSGGSNRATEQRSRTVRWRQGIVAFVSSRPDTVSIWKAALEREINALAFAESRCVV